MRVNPFIFDARLDGPAELPCVNATVSKGLTTSILHEARHGWQDFLTTVNDFGQDEIPGAPDNDDDQDFLVEGVQPCPCFVVVDSPDIRSVCKQDTGVVFDASYSGDSLSDLGGVLSHSFFPHEMDAHLFTFANAP